MKQKYPLKRMCDVGITLLDCVHKTPKPAKTGYPYIAIPEIRDGRLDLTNVRLISEADYLEWTKKTTPQAGDIVVTRRARVGDSAVIPPNLSCAIGQNLVILRSDNTQVLQTYLRWVLRSPQYWAEVEKYLNQGSIFDSLNCREIPLFEIPVPTLEIQKKVSSILSSLDDKIELNTRMNKVLEEIAQALFKRWFVDFEFPNEEGKPYRSSGGKMVESEMGLIPEGWQVRKLGEIINLPYGKPLKAENRIHGPYPVYGSNGIIGWHNKWMIKGPGIIIGRKGTPGVVTWSHQDFFPIDTTFYVESKLSCISVHFLYFLLKHLNLPNLSADSAVPGLNRVAALSQNFVFPHESKILDFEQITLHNFAKMQNLYLQNIVHDELLETLLSHLLHEENDII